MSVVADIAATYFGPRTVMHRLLGAGRHEGRALAFAMGFAVLAFAAQSPRLARTAHLEGGDPDIMLGGALFATVIVLPLFLYVIAGLAWLAGRALGGRVSGYGARLSLFWALLASAPVLLIHGLVAGMIGPGAAQVGLGLSWCAVVLWFWVSGHWQVAVEGA